MEKRRTLYEILGVAADAPDEVIRAAYKAMAQKNHPDKNVGNPRATFVMQEINSAYDVLSDSSRRAAYDDELRRTAAPPPRSSYTPQSPAPRAPDTPPPPVRYPKRTGRFPFFLVMICALGFIFVNYAARYLPFAGFTAPPPQERMTRLARPPVVSELTPQALAECVFTASRQHSVPPALLLGLLSAEGGTVGLATPRGANGFDLGLLQINSSWIAPLAKMWSMPEAAAEVRLRDDACANIAVGAWILQTVMKKNLGPRDTIAQYQQAAHHTTQPVPADYIDKIVRLADLYKYIRRPADLLDESKLPAAE